MVSRLKCPVKPESLLVMATKLYWLATEQTFLLLKMLVAQRVLRGLRGLLVRGQRDLPDPQDQQVLLAQLV